MWVAIRRTEPARWDDVRRQRRSFFRGSVLKWLRGRPLPSGGRVPPRMSMTWGGEWGRLWGTCQGVRVLAVAKGSMGRRGRKSALGMGVCGNNEKRVNKCEHRVVIRFTLPDMDQTSARFSWHIPHQRKPVNLITISIFIAHTSKFFQVRFPSRPTLVYPAQSRFQRINKCTANTFVHQRHEPIHSGSTLAFPGLLIQANSSRRVEEVGPVRWILAIWVVLCPSFALISVSGLRLPATNEMGHSTETSYKGPVLTVHRNRIVAVSAGSVMQ